MRPTFFGLSLFLLSLAIVVPSAPAAALNGSAPSARDAAVIFVAHDYGFSGPDRIPAGLTTMRIVNTGQDLHHVQLLKLLRGRSAADFRAAISADPTRLPAWVQYAGGPNANLPGSRTSATMNLTEGDYVLICWIPDKHGVPHVALGMQKALSVRGGKPSTVSAPKPSMTIKQIDYQFVLSKPIEPGLQTIEVVNHGTQPHELVVFKLDRGATIHDVIAAFEPGAAGPPPGQLVGGITGIDKGNRMYFTGDFEPGRYGLVCFVPDSGTGKPHFIHGMTAEFSVN